MSLIGKDLMQIKRRDVAGTRGYQIDNFYSHPEFIFNQILSAEDFGLLGSENGAPPRESLNGVKFIDSRHRKVVPELRSKIDVLELHVGNIKYTTNSKETSPVLLTNHMQWLDDEYNDFENNYWWPHYDNDWTCIIYLNYEKVNGTNIYKAVGDYREKVQSKQVEQANPWHSKEHFELIDYLEPSFNRAYLFQAGSLLHGAAINDKTYFNTNELFRLNQVMFFNEIKNA